MDKLEKIHVHIEDEGTHYQVETFENEYRSLMMLIFDKICPDDFGDCLGMGKCGTCIVAVEMMEESKPLTSFDRNEQTTLRKHGVVKDNFRLSCQLQIDEHINNYIFKIV